MDFRASFRREVKPQRVDKWSTDFHSSYVSSFASKSLQITKS